jgi:hypothetical protein
LRKNKGFLQSFLEKKHYAEDQKKGIGDLHEKRKGDLVDEELAQDDAPDGKGHPF